MRNHRQCLRRQRPGKHVFQMRHHGRSRAVFDAAKHRDAVSWTCLMSSYVDNAQPDAALRVFGEMVHDPGKCEPDRPAFLAALKACSSQGRRTTRSRLRDSVRRRGPQPV